MVAGRDYRSVWIQAAEVVELCCSVHGQSDPSGREVKITRRACRTPAVSQGERQASGKRLGDDKELRSTVRRLAGNARFGVRSISQGEDRRTCAPGGAAIIRRSISYPGWRQPALARLLKARTFPPSLRARSRSAGQGSPKPAPGAWFMLGLVAVVQISARMPSAATGDIDQVYLTRATARSRSK